MYPVRKFLLNRSFRVAINNNEKQCLDEALTDDTFPFQAITKRQRRVCKSYTQKSPPAYPRDIMQLAARLRDHAPQFHAVAKHRILRSSLCGYDRTRSLRQLRRSLLV